MKKLLALTLLAATLWTAPAKADDKVDNIFKTYRFGLFVSPTFNSLRATSGKFENYNITKGNGNVGFSFGIVADYNINDRYTVFSGLGLDWRGGGINASYDTTKPLDVDFAKRANIEYKQQYLTIPLGLKLKATQVDKLKIYAQTGFDLGLLLSNRGKADLVLSNNSKISNSEVVNLNKEGLAKAVPVNLGWHIGPGVEYDLNGKNAVFASILYRNGFTDATRPQNNKAGYKFSDGNIRSNTIAIRIGYFF
jgi:hypothetical protein